GVADPLWIVHEKLRNVSSNIEIPITAQIKHKSGVAQAKIYWKEEDETEFHELPMSNVDNDIWTTHLTAPMDAQRINYYIWAEANSGKSLTRPLPAPDGYWTFNIVSMATQDWANQNIQGPFPNPAKEKVHFDL